MGESAPIYGPEPETLSAPASPVPRAAIAIITTLQKGKATKPRSIMS
jgi:hypothetical protein